MKLQKLKNKDGSTSYRAQIYKKIGDKVYRQSASFSSRNLAIAWYDKRKLELERMAIYGESSRDTIQGVIERYIEAYGHNYGRSKNYDLKRIASYEISSLKVYELTPKAIILHCQDRNQTAKPQTVNNDVIWLRTVLKTMASVEGFNFDFSIFDRAGEVLKKEKLIAKSQPRDRRPTREELWKLSRYFYHKKLPMLHIMWFAIYSCRRLDEITRLRWDDNSDKQTGMVRDLKSPSGKGKNKRFKYTPGAWKIVQRQPKVSEFIFPYNSHSIGTAFWRACKVLGIEGLTFHSLRHEGVSRLFEQGLGIEIVQLYSLHENWSTLKRYTHLKPEDL